MELLLSGTDDQGRRRDLYVVTVAGLPQWSDALSGGVSSTEADDGFALFLALPGPPESAELIGDLATWCIGHGLFSMSAWGPDCSRVHDIFDEIDVELSIARDAPVMTSWHEDESLAESLDFFWDCTFADTGMPFGPVRLVLLVGAPSLLEETREWVADRSDV